jgi:hypothetical protein
MLIEKAYAKMYGSYPNIEGGLVDEALADLLMELHIGLI